jgi:glutathione synthase/RimK-type ligase-like ATP-grasp enzyme
MLSRLDGVVNARIRPHFTVQMERAAAACDVRLRWLSDGWVAQLTKGGHVTHVIGYTFPLNDAAAAQIANDKAATYVVLDQHHISVIVHRVLRLTAVPSEQLMAGVLDLVPLPVVTKPLTESAGIDVLRARDEKELHEAMRLLARRYRVIAVAPYVEITHEYRVVVLDDEVCILYEKCRQGDWRHNLHAGAVSKLVEDPDVVTDLSVLAQQVMHAMSLRFATVDIIEVDGRLAVLEVNNTVTLERFSAQNRAHADLAQKVYQDAVAACFVDTCSKHFRM